VALAIAAPPNFPLYLALRDRAARLFPDSLEQAFDAWCSLCREATRGRGFRQWASAAEHRDEAGALRALAALDVDAFFQAYPVDPEDEPEPPAPARELADA
jgi:hypothetical protein